MIIIAVVLKDEEEANKIIKNVPDDNFYWAEVVSDSHKTNLNYWKNKGTAMSHAFYRAFSAHTSNNSKNWWQKLLFWAVE